MKEARIITIVLFVLMIILFPINIYCFSSNYELIGNIISNINCGLLVGFITSLCQFFINKRRIKDEIYSLYYDIYYTYWIVLNNSIIRYNAFNFYNKIAKNGSKIVALLDDYHGLIIKEDKLYKVINSEIDYTGLGKEAKKSIFSLFNKKSFIKSSSPIINCIEGILKNINKNRFEKDFNNSIDLYNRVFK